MIEEITYPATQEEWFVKGTFKIQDLEVYFEIPGTFVDGVLDQVATEQNIQQQIEKITNNYLKNE